MLEHNDDAPWTGAHPNLSEDNGTDSYGTIGVVTFPTSVTATRRTPRPV